MKCWQVLKQQYRLITVGLIGIFLVVSVLIGMLKPGQSATPRNDFKPTSISSNAAKAHSNQGAGATSTKKDNFIYVDIKGAVLHPGVYQAMNNVRVETILGLAGGTLVEADLRQINLAQAVKDQQIIYIPHKGEQLPTQMQGSSEVSQVSDSTHKIVNLNSATKEDLQTLTGVGARKAEAILQYRQQHGNFKKIEEIQQVDGIGEKTFQKLKSFLAV